MPTLLQFPFTGNWLARNSPARKVPSHGTWLGGSGYAIDFIGLDSRDRLAPWGFASTFFTEPNEKFPGFGREIVAPCDGVIEQVYSKAHDHVARRSQFHLVGYMLSQKRRFREGGVRAITGNMVMIKTLHDEYVSLMHLQHDSVAVAVGQHVAVGDVLGKCGNTGNSTQPHVHIQVTDSPDLLHANAVEMAFYSADRLVPWMPGENEKFFAGTTRLG
ncbi:M23 family metallopeptidase [Corynebacterium lubricantis]|uniref:M23 family metallopeptidase n=1 Tax=Corynebacterium lubricantis TaxID=541095 RepID=UPI0003727F17|nr:M23 family metallopeptidase [Corynebacterium lubricantis]